MAGRRGHGRKYPPSKAPSTPSPGRCAPSSPTASHRANWRVPKIILSGPPCQGPPFSMPGRGCHAWNYPPSNAPLAPSPGRCPPSRGPPPPSSTHPIRPPLPGGPPLDAGAEGARLEVPPIEGPVGPVAGKVCPFEPPPGPLRVRRPSRRANWRVPKILLSGPPARPPPPSGCRGEEGTPRSTPHGKPRRPRPTEGAPLRAPLRPTAPWPTSSPTAKPPSELASTEDPPIRPPYQGSPFFMPGPKGHP